MEPATHYSSLCFANGVLYLATRTTFFAITHEANPPAPNGTSGSWPQWRGPNRDNISLEKGLLKEWPEGGPPPSWRVDGIGEGIAAVSIAGGQVYTLGYLEEGEFVTALDQQIGKRLWMTRIGPKVNENPLMRWLGQRSPTVDRDRLYAVTTGGRLVCLHTRNGRELWSKDYPNDFGSKRPSWGICDYPLVDGDNLICTPGSEQASIVALDKRTGKEIWRTVVPDAGRTAYTAMVVAEAGGVRQYVTFLDRALVGLNASDGRLLWTYDKVANRTANSNTPLVLGDRLLAGSGYGTGLALLKLTAQDKSVEANEVYFQRVGVNTFQDSSLVVGDHLFVGENLGVTCLDWKTGQRIWTARSRNGEFTYAEDRLYLRDGAGQVSLAEVSSKAYAAKGSFLIPDAVKTRGATSPVIAGGRLYLRDDNKLLCYDIRTTALDQPPTEPKRIVLAVPAAKPANQSRDRTLRSVFVPTPQDIVEQMLKLAEVKKSDLVYDLGSGDGRIVITAAKTYGCRAIGYELDKELVEQSRAKAEMAGVKSLVTIESKDLFTADLRDADVVAVYLLPQQLEKLLPQLETLKAGTRIVSHQFEIPGHKADRTITLESREDGANHTIFRLDRSTQEGLISDRHSIGFIDLHEGPLLLIHGDSHYLPKPKPRKCRPR